MKTFLANIWAKYGNVVIHEIGFWLVITGGYLVTDGAPILTALYNGQYASVGAKEVFLIIFSSGLKALLVLLFPSLFPLYRKGEGILPAKNQ